MSPVFDDQGRVKAAGGIPWRRCEDGSLEVLIAHRPRYDDWTFPKGKADEGELDSDCAVREVTEEVGYTGCLGPELVGTVYDDRSGRVKRVRYWAMEVTGGSFAENAEVDSVEWLPVKKARAKLSYKRDRPVVDDLACLGETRRGGPQIVLVRHGDASHPGSHDGPDEERPLTVRGRAQSVDIAARLRLLPFARVMSSPAARCQATAGAVAGDAVSIEVSEDLAEGRVRSTLALVKRASDVMVLATHGDVIPGVLRALAPEVLNHNGEGYSDWPCATASAWVLQRGDRWMARYVPPRPLN
ncbi:MAG: NUDIX hydrolase [Acidimicrobiales bacterium]